MCSIAGEVVRTRPERLKLGLCCEGEGNLWWVCSGGCGRLRSDFAASAAVRWGDYRRDWLDGGHGIPLRGQVV